MLEPRRECRDKLAHMRRFRLVEPRGRFIEQQQLGSRHDRAGNLQKPPVSVSQRGARAWRSCRVLRTSRPALIDPRCRSPRGGSAACSAWHRKSRNRSVHAARLRRFAARSFPTTASRSGTFAECRYVHAPRRNPRNVLVAEAAIRRLLTGKIPATTLRRVVLPAPLGPIRPCTLSRVTRSPPRRRLLRPQRAESRSWLRAARLRSFAAKHHCALRRARDRRRRIRLARCVRSPGSGA